MAIQRDASAEGKKHVPFGRLLAVILGLCFGLRLAYCLLIFAPVLHQRGEELGWVIDGRMAVDPYDRIAQNIVAGRGYVDDTGRTNYERLPLYVSFLALVYKFWGFELWKLQVIQSALDTITCFLIYYLAWKVFRRKPAALLAAACYAVYFKMLAVVARPETETLYTLALLAFLALWIASFQKTRLAFPAGISLGLLTLCKPITLLFPLIAAGTYYLKGKPLRLKKTVLFASGFMICVFPLFVRNSFREGRVFFSTGGGKMLYMGAVIDYSKNFRSEEQRLMKDIKTRYAVPYRPEDDDELRSLAFRNILAGPWPFLKRVACRLYLFWAYPDYSTPMMALKSILLLFFNFCLLFLAVWGWSLARKQSLFVSPFLWMFLYLYLVYAIIYAYSRYSLPLFPVLFIFSSYAVIHLGQKLKSKMSRPSPAAL